MITSPKDYKIYCIVRSTDNMLYKVGLNKTGMSLDRILNEYCKLKDLNPYDVKTIMLQTDFQNSDEAYKIKSIYIQAFELLDKMIN